MRIKLNEALALSTANGKNVKKNELAAKIWPGSNSSAQAVNMTNLCNGTTKRVDPYWIVIICRELGCTSDFLFGLK